MAELETLMGKSLSLEESIAGATPDGEARCGGQAPGYPSPFEPGTLAIQGSGAV